MTSTSKEREGMPDNWNHPDFVWTVHKEVATGKILGPSVPFGIVTRATYATLDDLGRWHEVENDFSPRPVKDEG